MTQHERWMVRYNEVSEFISSNHRNPSKYADEERRMLHFFEERKKNDERRRTEGTEIVVVQGVVGVE